MAAGYFLRSRSRASLNWGGTWLNGFRSVAGIGGRRYQRHIQRVNKMNVTGMVRGMSAYFVYGIKGCKGKIGWQ